MKQKVIKWTKEMCFNVAKNYNSVSEFSKNSASDAAQRMGIYKEVVKHMTKLREANNTLDYEYCKKISLNFKTKRELFLSNESVYLKSRTNNWLNEFFPENKYKPNGYWTKDRCLEETKKFKNRSEFRINCKTVYTIVVRNRWLEEFFPNN